MYVAVSKGWLCVYESYNSVYPLYTYRLCGCTAASGDQIAHEPSVQIAFSSGYDIFLILKPKLSHPSNNFNFGASNGSNVKNEFDWIKAINKCSESVSDQVTLNAIISAPSVELNNATKQLFSCCQSQPEDSSVYAYFQCVLLDQTQAFKQYQTTIYFLENQFIIQYVGQDSLSQNGSSMMTRRYYYYDIQDCKDPKQNTVEVVVADQSILLKFKPEIKIQFVVTLVDFWQQSLGQIPTSFKNKAPTAASLTRKDKGGFVWKRSSGSDWKLSYLVVYNQFAFLYDSPLSEKPYDYFDLGCCVCQSATQNLIEKPVSQFESKQAGQYQVRETQFDQVPYEFMLYSADNSLRKPNNFSLQQDI